MQIQGEGSGLVVGSGQCVRMGQVEQWSTGVSEWAGGSLSVCGVEWSGRVGREDTRLDCTQARMRAGETMHDVKIEHDNLNMNELYYKYSASNTLIDSTVIDHSKMDDSNMIQHG